MTLELYEYQKEKINKPEFSGLKSVYETIELPILPIITKMQRYGVNINQGMLDELYNKYNERLKKAESEVLKEIEPYKDKILEYKITHYNHKLSDPIMITSPMQLSILFYDIIGYKTKSGKGTGVAELEEINSPLTKALLEYRKMSKLIDAFLVALPKKIEPTTNKVHTQLNQYGAETGRFSSSEPNLQQIPSRGEAKEIRRVFGASKGYVMMSSDFSQQEPRILAHMSEEDSMKKAYFEGKDLYATMAASAFKKEYWECMEEYLDENGKKNGIPFPEGKKRRSAIKGVLLGIMYGRGTTSVAEQLHMTTEEAQKIIDDFFEAYPRIKQFVEAKQIEAKQRGFTETAWGRRRYIQHIQDEKFEYKYNDKRPVDFNPLFTARTVLQEEVSQEIKDKYNEQLENCNSFKRKKIIEKAKLEGIDITDNGGYIAEANRQVVNSIIQGRWHCPYTLNPITQGCVI